MSAAVRSFFATVAVVAGIVLLMASLSLVTWRQSRAFEALAELDRLQRERSLAESKLAELDRRIQHLESRTRVVPEARDRLGLHVPGDDEIVHLEGGTP